MLGCQHRPETRSPGTLRMVQRLPAQPTARIPFEGRFATELLRAGQTAEAIATFDRLSREITGYDGPGARKIERELLDRLDLSQLTVALRDWCLNGTPGERCIVPAPANAAAAPAARRRQARNAVETYGRLLQSLPADRQALGLLNLASMILGQYPDSVPAQWLIPAQALASEYPLPGFLEVAAGLGLDVAGPSGGSIMDDFNGDGLLDIMISSMGPDDQRRLFFNPGDGTFSERTREAGLRGIVGGLNLVQTDYDNDGRLDVLVLRGGWDRLGGQPLSLLHNLGGGRFEDLSEAAGLRGNRSTQTAARGDFNNDGWLDILVLGYRYLRPRTCAADVAAEYLGLPYEAETRRRFRNHRNGTFSDVAPKVRLDRVVDAMGASFGDLDNDGFPDLYAATGDPDLHSIIPNRMFRNDAGNRFQDVTAAGGFGLLTKGHGVSFGDLDGDGDQDIYVNMGGMFEADVGRSVLFENPGFGNHWITLKLEGVKSNRAAIGARIRVLVDTDRGPREVHALVSSGGSFGGNSLQQEIGLGPARAVREVRIAWPGGGTATSTSLTLDQAYTIREGDPAKPAALRPFRLRSAAAKNKPYR